MTYPFEVHKRFSKRLRVAGRWTALSSRDQHHPSTLLAHLSRLMASDSMLAQTSSRESLLSSLAHCIRVARSSIARRSLRHPLELRVISAATCCGVSEHGKRTLASNDNFSLPTR